MDAIHSSIHTSCSAAVKTSGATDLEPRRFKDSGEAGVESNSTGSRLMAAGESVSSGLEVLTGDMGHSGESAIDATMTVGVSAGKRRLG